MSQGVAYTNLADLVGNTLNTLQKRDWTDIASDLQKYVAARQLINDYRKVVEGGLGYDWQLLTDENYSARPVGLFAEDEVNVNDVSTNGFVPWRHITANYAFDRKEAAMNKGASKIVDTILMRRASCHLSLAKLFERLFWSAAGEGDTLNPWGVDNYIVRWTSGTATPGFTGDFAYGDGATWTTGPAGISPTTYPNWKNWAGQYTSITKDDLIAKMREAFVKTEWMPPMEVPENIISYGYGIYMNYDVLKDMEKGAEDQNDSLGNDIASMDGKTLFRGVPLTWVPYLDDDASDPVYMLDWDSFGSVFLQGEELYEDPPRPSPRMLNVTEVHMNASYNIVCTNRRKNAVLSKLAKDGSSS